MYEIKYNKGRKGYILFSGFEKCLQTRKEHFNLDGCNKFKINYILFF